MYYVNSPCVVPSQPAANLSVPARPHGPRPWARASDGRSCVLSPLLGGAGKCHDPESPAHCSSAAYNVFAFSIRIVSDSWNFFSPPSSGTFWNIGHMKTNSVR